MWILLGVVVIIVIWVISAQRGLVHLDELCKNALSQIGVQQASRWDALSALADLTKGYSEHEYKALTDIIGQRRSIGMNSTAAEAQGQENMITEALGKIMAIGEAYPDLKANTVYIKTMDSVNQYENNVRMSRMVYNDSVTKYNRTIRQIPTSIVAGMLNFKERDYLQEDATKTQMPKMA